MRQNKFKKVPPQNVHNVLFSTLVPFLRFLATGGKNTHTHTHTHTDTHTQTHTHTDTHTDTDTHRHRDTHTHTRVCVGLIWPRESA